MWRERDEGMSEHAPAPWTWKGTERDLRDLDTELGADLDGLYDADGSEVLYPIWHNDSTAGVGVVGSANARLIAAAPELLEVVEELIKCRVPDEMFGLIDMARAAIAKAKGEKA